MAIQVLVVTVMAGSAAELGLVNGARWLPYMLFGLVRSINRAMIVVAAPLGGLLADRIGYRATIQLAAGGFVLVAIGMSMTPFREARIEQG